MKTELTFHARLQNRILWAANIITMVLFVALVVAAIILKNTAFIVLGVFGSVIFASSILFQAFRFYTISSYISVYSIMFLGFMNVMTRPTIDADYLYMLISYSAIAMVLSGLLARQRSFPLVVWFIEMVLLSYYFFGEQVPAIGADHVMHIIDSYAVMIILGTFSYQIFLLSGQMMNKYVEEVQTTMELDKQIQDIIDIYKNNQNVGNSMEHVNINNDSIASQMHELFQKFMEDTNELTQMLKDTTIRNDNVSNSNNNIMKVFSNHKEHIMDYKVKIDRIAETSQDIDFIVQDRKVQMGELIELSEKGGQHMQESIIAVEKVAENSKNMVDMISLIMEVAEKTNILALNAAVEASRAGKYGGGFAIVAKEIKSLSTETTQNADTINRSLQSNIATISEAVTIIKTVGQSFVALNSNIHEFSTAIDQIVIKMGNLNQQNSQMSIETKNTLSLIAEVQNVIEKTLQTIEQGQNKIVSIQGLTLKLEKDVAVMQQTTNNMCNSGRKVQEKYKEYCYSIKKVDDIIETIEIQAK